ATISSWRLSLPLLVLLFFLLPVRRPPTPTLFPYTTLFRSHPDGSLEVRVRQGPIDHRVRPTSRVRSPMATDAPAGSTVAVLGTRLSREPSSRRIAAPLVDPRSVTVVVSPVPSMRRWVLDTERVSSLNTNSTSSSEAEGLRPTTTGFCTDRSVPSSATSRRVGTGGTDAEIRVCSRSPRSPSSGCK